MAFQEAPIPQSAILPFRMRRKSLQVLLVTSLTSRRWVLPKGHIDEPLTPRQSAEKEAFEEAGVSGKIAKKSIGAYTYVKNDVGEGVLYHVEVFPMEVKDELDTWPEDIRRTRKWMSPAKAAAAVDEDDLAALIRAFAKAQSK